MRLTSGLAVVSGLREFDRDDGPHQRALEPYDGAVLGDEVAKSAGRPVVDVARRIAELPHVSPTQEMECTPQGFAGDAQDECTIRDSGHLVQSVSRTLDMLEDLERRDAVERPVVEWQLVRRCRGEREQSSGPTLPFCPQRVVSQVNADRRDACPPGETLGHDALAAPDVENRAGSKRVDRFVDLAQKAPEERARNRVPARVLVGGIARRPDKVRRVDGIAGAQRRTSSTICSIRSRSSRRSSCCDVISSESRPSDTNWIPTTTSSTPSVRSGRCPIACPQNHSIVR